ncbi:hypothetical protein N8612_05945 [Verrucomicrobia bacterium]|nr:hypothetical protein [Verrucomicrobiota bacterium]
MKKMRDEFIDKGIIARLSFQSVQRNGVFDFARLIPVIAKVYRTHHSEDYRMPKSDYLKYDGRPSYDRIITLLGYLGGEFSVSGVKEICSSTLNHKRGLPRASGLIILNDTDSQRPFAILEASQISAARTAAVTGLAISELGPSEMHKVGWLGCGYLAQTHATLWSQQFKDRCDEIHYYDPNPEFRSRFHGVLADVGLRGIECDSPEAVVRDSDVIIPMTTSEEPYIDPTWIKEESLYSAVSLLDPHLDVLKQSDSIVVDDLEICKAEGRPLQLMEEAGDLDAKSVHSMGEVLCKELRIRSGEGKGRVFFNPMGTVLTDLGVALAVLENAVQNNDFESLEW